MARLTQIRRGLIAVFLCVSPGVPFAEDHAAPDRATAAAVFQRLKSQAGSWDGRSTKGWTGTTEVREIARGSALLSLSTFSAHPANNEGMATVFHMDGDRLLLTHYCVAGNQPRLALTRVADGGNTLEFTFFDGGGLPTREAAGHMDRLVMRLESPDRFVSRWTWYQAGAERWLEEIVYTRKS